MSDLENQRARIAALRGALQEGGAGWVNPEDDPEPDARSAPPPRRPPPASPAAARSAGNATAYGYGARGVNWPQFAALTFLLAVCGYGWYLGADYTRKFLATVAGAGWADDIWWWVIGPGLLVGLGLSLIEHQFVPKVRDRDKIIIWIVVGLASCYMTYRGMLPDMALRLAQGLDIPMMGGITPDPANPGIALADNTLIINVALVSVLLEYVPVYLTARFFPEWRAVLSQIGNIKLDVKRMFKRLRAGNAAR
jgi:hypothetical protein